MLFGTVAIVAAVFFGMAAMTRRKLARTAIAEVDWRSLTAAGLDPATGARRAPVDYHLPPPVRHNTLFELAERKGPLPRTPGSTLELGQAEDSIALDGGAGEEGSTHL